MPNINDLQPVVRKTRPVFLMYEVASEPSQRPEDALFLKRCLSAVAAVSDPAAGYIPHYFLLPYGEFCNPELQQGSHPSALDPGQIYGTRQVDLAQALVLLNDLLSGKNAPVFPTGCLPPTIALLTASAPDSSLKDALQQLRKNRVFSVARRLVFHGWQPDARFRDAFTKDLDGRTFFVRFPHTADALNTLCNHYGIPLPPAEPDLPGFSDPMSLVRVDPVTGLPPDDDYQGGMTADPRFGEISLMGDATCDPDYEIGVF